MNGGNTTQEMKIKEACFKVREEIENLKKFVFALQRHSVFNSEQEQRYQHSEMKANLMLTYRHLEDARMRLGKVVQAYDGGKSIYPR